jgi:hypothetical protein
MSISIRDQKILNDFPKTYTELQRPGELSPNATPKIGDYCVDGTSKITFTTSYSFAKDGPFSLSNNVYLDSSKLPAGVMLTSIIMEVVSPVTFSAAGSILLGLTTKPATGIQLLLPSVPIADYGSVQIKQYPLIGIINLVSSQFKYISIFASATGPVSTGGILNFHMTYSNPKQLLK